MMVLLQSHLQSLPMDPHRLRLLLVLLVVQEEDCQRDHHQEMQEIPDQRGHRGHQQQSWRGHQLGPWLHHHKCAV